MTLKASLTLPALRTSGRAYEDATAVQREAITAGYSRGRGQGRGERAGWGEAGREAEASSSHKGAVRARDEASLEVQGVQRLSARSSAP